MGCTVKPLNIAMHGPVGITELVLYRAVKNIVFFIQYPLERYLLGMGDVDILVCEYCDDY